MSSSALPESSDANFISGHLCSLFSACQSPVSPATSSSGSQGHSWWLLLSFLVISGHRLLGPVTSLSPPPPLPRASASGDSSGISSRLAGLHTWLEAPVHEVCTLESLLPICQLSWTENALEGIK